MMMQYFSDCLGLFNGVYAAAVSQLYGGFMVAVAGFLVSLAAFRYLLRRSRR